MIGGTGMLSDLVRKLAPVSDCISIIARNQSRINELVTELKQITKVYGISTDYYDIEDLFLQITTSTAIYGPVDMVVSYIHSPAVQATPVVAAAISSGKSKAVQFYDVRSSSISNIDLSKDERLSQVAEFAELDYHRVVLGCKVEGGRFRWLTDKEISEGVFEAIISGKKDQLVGNQLPMDKRIRS